MSTLVIVCTVNSAAQELQGLWKVERYELIGTRTLTSRSQRAFTRRSIEIDSMNRDLQSGILEIRAEFKPDSTYIYKLLRNQRVEYFETGRWKRKASSISATTTSGKRSVVDGSTIVGRTEEVLTVMFRVGRIRDGIREKIFYRRIR